jgi:chromosome segregation ATPase
MAGTTVIDNIKSAKKEVRSLVKQAQAEIKKKNIDKGIEFYQNAVLIASNWDLTKDVGQIQDTIRLIRIEYLKEKMKILESEGRKAAKGEEYTVAADKYKKASEAASEIFKLGITEMTKEVKRLTNKAKEYGKLS